MSNFEVSTVDVATGDVATGDAASTGLMPSILPKPAIKTKNGARNYQKTIKSPIIYPESDGMPMAENTEQYDELTNFKGNVEILFKKAPNVFVAGDLFWYPVEGRNDIKYAPDVMVVFGRPKGRRGSYRQWEEGDIAPQVVLEIWPPGNKQAEKDKKFAFYNRYRVEEYYTYDPAKGELCGWLREGETLQEIADMQNWYSPRLGICFTMRNKKMKLFLPNGRPFRSHVEKDDDLKEALKAHRDEAEARAVAEAKLAETEVENERNKALLEQAMALLKQAGLSDDLSSLT
ncbi:MAG: Uma2 family endonuclease [Chloroflexota bacterium]